MDNDLREHEISLTKNENGTCTMIKSRFYHLNLKDVGIVLGFKKNMGISPGVEITSQQ